MVLENVLSLGSIAFKLKYSLGFFGFKESVLFRTFVAYNGPK